MPETPVGYFPDVKVSFAPSLVTMFATEIEVDPHSGIEQRRARSVSSGQRMWRASTVPQEQAVRRSIYEFLKAKRGQLYAFYFFAPDPSYVFDAALGSVSAATSIIVPWKGGTYNDVRVAGIPQAVTVRALSPRENVFSALRFDGVNDYIDGGSGGTLKIVGDHSYAGWVYLASYAGSPAIVSNLNFPASGTEIRVGATGLMSYFAANGAGASASATTAIPLGTWTHFAVVRSGTTITFYVNGVASNSGSVAVQAVATLNFIMGRAAAASTQFLNGMLADVRVYQIALTAANVLNLYNGTPTSDANNKAWWKMDDGTGTTTPDSSGTGNTGSLFGPTWVAGEDELTFTSGAQTGAVTGTLTGRQRVVARSMRDGIDQSFMSNVADVRAAFPVEIMELP